MQNHSLLNALSEV